MAYIHVDIDVTEFDTDEILSEAIHRLNSHKKLSLRDQNYKNELINMVKDLYEQLEFEKNDISETIEIKTLDDKYKLEHLSKIWNKYTPTDFENNLP